MAALLDPSQVTNPATLVGPNLPDMIDWSKYSPENIPWTPYPIQNYFVLDNEALRQPGSLWGNVLGSPENLSGSEGGPLGFNYSVMPTLGEPSNWTRRWVQETYPEYFNGQYQLREETAGWNPASGYKALASPINIHTTPWGSSLEVYNAGDLQRKAPKKDFLDYAWIIPAAFAGAAAAGLFGAGAGAGTAASAGALGTEAAAAMDLAYGLTAAQEAALISSVPEAAAYLGAGTAAASAAPTVTGTLADAAATAAEGVAGGVEGGTGLTISNTTGLSLPTTPTIPEMGVGGGLTLETVPAGFPGAGESLGGTLGAGGLTTAGATPSLGNPASFINDPEVLGTDVTGKAPTTTPEPDLPSFDPDKVPTSTPSSTSTSASSDNKSGASDLDLLAAALSAYMGGETSEDQRKFLDDLINRADPFGAQRPYYQGLLKGSYDNPASYLESPEYLAVRSKMQRELEAKDAAAGRRSQYGGREQYLAENALANLDNWRKNLLVSSGATINPNDVLKAAALGTTLVPGLAREQGIGDIINAISGWREAGGNFTGIMDEIPDLVSVGGLGNVFKFLDDVFDL